jgi:outer membrane protein assembly factor BamB
MRNIIISALTLILIFISKAAIAQASLTSSLAGGHPGLQVTVTGASFAAGEAVDVYFDTTDTLLLVSSTSGTLSGSITVPASATPGVHYITAVGRQSNDAAQAAFNVSTAWLEMGFGTAHLNWNPYENVLSTSNVPQLGSLWTAHPGALGGTPAIVSGRIIVGTTTGVVSLAVTTGATQWSKSLGQSFYGSAALANASVYIGSTSGTFYSLNYSTGATNWSTSLGGIIYASALVSNGLVYVGSSNGTFYALLASTGAVAWSYNTGSNSSIYGSAAIDDGMVFFGSSSGAIYALNATTGQLIATYTTGGIIESSPAIANHVLYIGSEDHKVYAIGTSGINAGRLVWTYTTGGAVDASPAVANGIVYIGSTDDKLYALNAQTGGLVWSLTTGGTVYSATVANGIVYVTSGDNTAYAVSASNGGVLATGVTGPAFFGSPAVSDGRVFISTLGGAVYAAAPNAGVDALFVKRAPEPATLRPNLSLKVTS